MAFAQNRIPGVIALSDPSWFPDPVREPLSVEVLPGSPARTRVSDSRGTSAVLTTGARTVVVRGSKRSFTEQKQPFADAFARAVTGDWGPSPGGGTWTTANGGPANYAVEPGRGVIILSQNNSSFFATPTTRRRRLLRHGAAHPGHRARGRRHLGGPHLRLPGLRQPLPRAVEDATFGAGKLGVRAIASKGSTAVPSRALVHEFAATGVWTRPPVVTHDTWVRLLLAPFDGMWGPEVEQRVRAWPTDISPDALALVAMLQTGAAPYHSPAQGGAQVLGESGYGPLNPDGTRVEGSDFHEYMGIPWTFPGGERKPAPEPHWHRTLDCSGMVRMVFGYHLGVPMFYDDPDDFDGATLLRRSRDIGPLGPGVVVHRDDTAPPPTTGLQLGDVVCFDADPDTAGELDHVGVYVGQDQDGRHRFASSRKTVNGPTISDLGGASTLDGTGTYARSLRIIRRF